jgi:uncharacterized protein YkwD
MSFSKRTGGVVAVLAVLLFGVPSASASAACGSADVTASQASKSTLARATLCVLNAQRARHHLPRLSLNSKLSSAASGHSLAMVRGRFFSHDSKDGSSFVDRIRRSGYLSGPGGWSVGENIAYGSGDRSSPRSIGRAWMNSPPHRANILSRSFREIGIGVAYGTPVGGGGATYTTDFGKRS